MHAGVAGPTADEGQKAHKKLQSRLSANQQAEVSVKANITLNNATLALSGRIDVLESANDHHMIKEIKSCYAPPEKIPPATRNLHWAQLKVYGYCILQSPETKANSISLQLLWFNIHTEEVTTETQVATFDELQAFTEHAARLYIEWLELIGKLSERTIKSAKALTFPHAEFRAGQREMAGSIYLTTRDKGALLCEAPTGIGKTISALFPAAKAMGEGLIDSAVYLTAKTSGRQSANDAVAQLQQNGLFITAVTITAKKSTCHCTNGTCECNREGQCPLTVGFFDRLPQARSALIQQGMITPAMIDNAAHQYQLCPFELTLQLLPWVNLVICDFNYVFDPLVRLTHFAEAAKSKLLLVDETHNLIDRARSMYSARLHRQQLLEAADDATDNNPFLAKVFKSVAAAVQRVSRHEAEAEFTLDKAPQNVSRAVGKCVDALATTLENATPLTESQAEAAKELYRYLVIEDLFGSHHRAISISRHTGRKSSTKHTTLLLQCLNATDRLAGSFKQFKACVAFSATLRPQSYFQTALGLPDQAQCLALPSPFAAQQQGTFLCRWIDTRYQKRPQSVKPLAEMAHRVVTARPGNYQIFFPSYAFMEEVHTEFCKRFPDITTIMQQRGSDDTQRKAFLSHFEAHHQLLAFSIMGGIYGEGVDYVGNRLIGSIIVGTGLASINLQQKLIEQDYQSQGLNGFDYASKYPGLTRVLQTAGRVIRSETDTGVVILADCRFGDTFYQQWFPQHWQVNHCTDLDALHTGLHQFWADHFSLG